MADGAGLEGTKHADLRIWLSRGTCTEMTRSRTSMGLPSRAPATFAPWGSTQPLIPSSVRPPAWDGRRAGFSQAALTCWAANEAECPLREQQCLRALLTTHTKPQSPISLAGPSRPHQLPRPLIPGMFLMAEEECKALGCSGDQRRALPKRDSG